MSGKETILLVDDSPTILSILKEMLKGNGFDLLTASSGKEALTIAKKHPPDLILLDIVMPEIDGVDTCRQFKSHEPLSKIPILFLSSFEDVRNKIKGFEAGGLDYINKPVQREELIARVKIHLELKRLQEALYRKIEDKERLIHVLCHDISNPLTCISVWAELILEMDGIGENVNLSNKIQRILLSAQQVTEIIDHVREMERLSRQKNRLQLGPVSVKEVISNALLIFENQLKNKDIAFRCFPALEELESEIIAEKISFTTNVFNNLLSNSIKFSYPSSVITFIVEEKEEKVHLVLKDQGIGIPGDLLENIFNPGTSTSRPGTSGEEGSGFGMPLVKKYMDYYEGDIIISSHPKEVSPDLHGTEIQLILKNGKKI
jgi:DNA-binding response OmpR family regulator